MSTTPLTITIYTPSPNLWCTVCKCWADKCKDTGHADWYMTPEQLATNDHIEAGGARYDDRT